MQNPALDDIARRFVANGGGNSPPPYGQYRAEIDVSLEGMAMDFFKEGEPISTSVGSWSARHAPEYWSAIEEDYHALHRAEPQLFTGEHPVTMPDSALWLRACLRAERQRDGSFVR